MKRPKIEDYSTTPITAGWDYQKFSKALEAYANWLEAVNRATFENSVVASGTAEQQIAELKELLELANDALEYERQKILNKH